MAGRKKQPELTAEEKLQQALVPEAEQPYKVPDNWCWTYLKSITDCLDNFRKPINASERNTRLGDIPYYGATGQVGWIDDYLTNEELVLLGEDGAPFLDLLKNKAYLINGKAWVNNHAHILRSKFGTTGNRFLVEYLNNFDFTGFVTGTTRLKLTQASMNKIIFPLPPLAEQQRIVERIETLFAKLDEAKEKLQNTLDTFETRKAAILHKAFTGELTANWRKHHGLTMDSWEEKTLGEVANSQYGYTESATDEAIGPKFLRITDIQNGFVNWDEVPYCKISDKELDKYILSVDDIVIARTGATTGKSYLIKDKINSVFASYLIRLKLKTKNVLADFIYQYMQSQFYWTQITDFSKGIAQPGVNAQKLKEIKFNLPIVDEQTEIVRIIDNLLAKEQQAYSVAQNAITKIELIKKSILARAFRGQLATNNPADESAVELLKKVL